MLIDYVKVHRHLGDKDAVSLRPDAAPEGGMTDIPAEDLDHHYTVMAKARGF
ncbi:MAG: hypothetical protein HZB33_02675 [Nitrospirae bacterium]|nr:hypothetical protein [Nitrospirota bacterium]